MTAVPCTPCTRYKLEWYCCTCVQSISNTINTAVCPRIEEQQRMYQNDYDTLTKSSSNAVRTPPYTHRQQYCCNIVSKRSRQGQDTTITRRPQQRTSNKQARQHDSMPLQNSDGRAHGCTIPSRVSEQRQQRCVGVFFEISRFQFKLLYHIYICTAVC